MGGIIIKEVVKPTFQNVWLCEQIQQANYEISGSRFSPAELRKSHLDSTDKWIFT